MQDNVPNFVGQDFQDLIIRRATEVPGDLTWTLRVASRDNAHYVLTRDWDEHRINVQLENGIVVAQTVG